ncbi:MAG TPA: hypothetical protein VI251_02735 [Pseudolabrys sp.]|jgi:hypothetical protein
MTGKLLSRDNISVVLVCAMGVFLALAVIGGTVSLILGKQVIGNDVGTVADVSGWLYAAALLSVFCLTLSKQRSAGHTPRLD